MKRRWMRSLWAAAFLSILFEKRAWAYFDPGAGSMMLQVVLGAVVGAFFAIRRKAAAVFQRLFGRKEKPEPDGK